MKWLLSFAILPACLFAFLAESKNDGPLSLSKRKRYVVFPEGSSFSVAICMTWLALNPTNIFTESLNWGISYDLPNDTSIFKDYIDQKHTLRRRHRRDLYHNMEVIMNSMGYDGRACIFRALCEASRKLFWQDNTIVEEFLRIVFKFPLKNLMRSEPEEHRLYHWAHRIGQDSDKECSEIFPACSFSLIDMALGEYTHLVDNDVPSD